MGVRSNYDEKQYSIINQRIDQYFARIYFMWMIGLTISALNLRVSGYQLNGITFSLSNQDALQGLFFLAVYFYYAAIIFNAITFGSQYGVPSIHIYRRVIYISLGNKKYLRGRSVRDIQNIKRLARVWYTIIAIFFLLSFLLPFFQIAIFEVEPLFKAVNLLF